MTDRRPNILFIISDQHSKYHLGCYGNPIVRTPHLDRLASEGMQLTNAYTAAPVCVPARMAFMTSRHPSRNEVWTNGHMLSSAAPTWAHAVGAAGYETALIGRMHFVGSDQRHGFERRPLGEYSAHYPGAGRVGGPMFKSIPSSTSGQIREAVEIAGYGRTTYQAFDEQVAEAGVAYLKEKAREGRPFAAVAGFVLPHCSFFAPKALFDYYYERVDIPEPSAAELAAEPAAIGRFKRNRDIERPLPAERIRVARAAYFGLCEYFDAQVGKLLAALDETGLADNTLVVYLSDHGEMAGEHGCWWKSNYYEGSVGVPLIARWPGHIAAGAVDDTLCSLLDLGPLAVELAAGEPLPGADGHSLWPVLAGQEDRARPDAVYSELGSRPGEPPSRMIRQGRWKLYQYGAESPALFDLEADPDELCDLGTAAGPAAVRDELLARLNRDWDPQKVAVRSAELARDAEVIAAWGQVVGPRHEDTLPVPDVEAVVRV
ncbi:MAG: sulfatase [Gemmatimonadetes bacterium]|nr:sulfatase [Gemmatimonadota bacterium]